MKEFLRSIEIIRRPLVVVIHLFLIALSNYLAFWLRYEEGIPPRIFELMLLMMPLLLLIRGVAFAVMRLFQGLWRYTSIWDLKNILVAILTSTTVFFIVVRLILGYHRYPRSIFIIDAVLLTCFLGSVRLPWRIFRELKRPQKGKRILIYGAGDAGEMIVRDMKNNPYYGYQPVGFIDDEPTKRGHSIHGISVLGGRDELPAFVESKRADEILIAMPAAHPATVREIVKALRLLKLPIKTLPNIRDILDGSVGVNQIRNLSVEDLLIRIPVTMTLTGVRKFLEGKRVMVTGAGGSIGSELCRQIAALKPSLLVLFERYENGLFALTNSLEESYPQLAIRPIIGDIKDARRVHHLLESDKIEIIFHAAAHKHVPLMEINPTEAIKNNVAGTRILIHAAEEHKVQSFILISSDKAVNPTSHMGASKRICELMVRSKTESPTRYLGVRFGNVLASNGSVVPLFMEQIKKGGPVTVTHPEMRRYFMLISEAVQLVLQAAAIGLPGSIYCLEMGDQIKIADMARHIIRLSGFIPDEEIPIKFVGLRPGEKLYEELVGVDESLQPSGIDNIYHVEAPNNQKIALNEVLALEEAAWRGNSADVTRELNRLLSSSLQENHRSRNNPNPDEPENLLDASWP